MKMKVVAALLLLALLVVRADHDDDSVSVSDDDDWKLQPTQQTTVPLSLNVSLPADRYSAFMSELERQLALTTKKPHIEKRPVLGVQKSRPDQWFHITLKGQGLAESTLAIRADNLYLIAFKPTAQAPWYAFKNRAELIQGSTALPFADDYRSLTGGSYKELGKVVVGRKAAQEALDTLANYKQGSTSTPEPVIKKALLRFIVVFAEAARFQPVRADVIAAWNTEDGGKLRGVSVELTVKWREISCALLGLSKGKKWGSIVEAKEIDQLGDPLIKSPKAAAENVYCILQATNCKPLNVVY